MITKYLLYDGKIELCFDDTKHIYSVNDEIVYGVTNILGVLDKPAIIYWAVNQAIDKVQEILQPGVALDEIQIKNLLDEAKSAHRQKKDKAADVGALVHEWIDKFFKAIIEKKPLPKPPVNQEMKNALQGLKEWIRGNKIVPLSSEQKIYHIDEKYAGTYDLLAKVNGKITIIDFKTSNNLYDEHLLQAASYLKAEEKEHGKILDGGVILIRLSKEDKEKNIAPFEIKQMAREEVDNLFEVFLSCKRIYKWKMKNKKLAILNNINGFKVEKEIINEPKKVSKIVSKKRRIIKKK